MTLKFVTAVLIILLAGATFKIMVYESLIPKLYFSATTLKADWTAERKLYLSCKNETRV